MAFDKDYLNEFLTKHEKEIREQLKNSPFELSKICDICGFVCMTGEHMCRNCHGYKFVPNTENKKATLSVAAEFGI
jgi:hypothetical protein